MPHKMNARSSERVNGLKLVIDGHLTMAAGLAGRQWNEGDVSCSVVRRVMLPDAFMAADGLIQTALSVFDEFGVFDFTIVEVFDPPFGDAFVDLVCLLSMLLTHRFCCAGITLATLSSFNSNSNHQPIHL